MFDDEVRAFLHSGCALIIATVAEDGAPHAGRCWGLDVLSDATADGDEEVRVRVLVDAEDPATIEHVAAGGLVAVTATSVVTMRSLQLKGRSLGVDPATEEDVARGARYCAEFFRDIERTDDTPRPIIESLEPVGYVSFTASIDQVFDQTPGPLAGAAIDGRSR